MRRVLFVLALAVPAGRRSRRTSGPTWAARWASPVQGLVRPPTPTVLACDDNDTAWKLLGGYRFNRYFALEGSYIDWGKVTASVCTGAAGVAAKQHSYGLAARRHACRSGERFELFGKAGFLMTEQETRRITPTPSTVNRDETELHYGARREIRLHAGTGRRAASGRSTDKLKVEMLSIGVEYRF